MRIRDACMFASARTGPGAAPSLCFPYREQPNGQPTATRHDPKDEKLRQPFRRGQTGVHGEIRRLSGDAWLRLREYLVRIKPRAGSAEHEGAGASSGTLRERRFERTAAAGRTGAPLLAAGSLGAYSR